MVSETKIWVLTLLVVILLGESLILDHLNLDNKEICVPLLLYIFTSLSIPACNNVIYVKLNMSSNEYLKL